MSPKRNGESRGNALWGKGSGGSRSNALWGKGGRGLVVALLGASLLVPTMAVGGDGGSKQSSATFPTGSLLAEAQAAPDKLFPVIVQASSKRAVALVSRYVDDAGGEKKRSFRSIDGLSANLPGKALLFLDKHADRFGGEITITRDRMVRVADLAGGPMWQRSINADDLWDRSAVTCLTEPLTGILLDPSCVEKPAYTAPQAPAIAIVDSGVDPTRLADFGGRLVASVNLSTLPTLFPAGDGQGHGTLVAGVAAGASALAPGVAQNAPIVSVRTSDENGQSLTSDVIAGVDWILANKDALNIRVANFSLVGTEETSFKFDPLDKAVEKLWLSGVTVVAAAGNNGSPDGPVKIGAPANDPFVITVGALDQNGTEDAADDFRAPWSAYGPTADGFAKPELAAPGRYIVGPVPATATLPGLLPERLVEPGYMWMSGTSFSAPMVAGAAAQLLALNPSWGPDEVKGALMYSTNPLGGTVGVGVGEIDVLAASQVASPPNPNENLYAFVSTDEETGLREFDSASWEDAVSSSASWSSASWSSASWSSASWSSASWSSASWSSASWSSASWSSASWSSASWSSASWSSASWNSSTLMP